jgi:hypothetical protein
MEACQCVEVTGVLAGGAELADNVELGSGAQRVGGWRVEVTGVLAASTKLAGNAELGGATQRAVWGQHGRR